MEGFARRISQLNIKFEQRPENVTPETNKEVNDSDATSNQAILQAIT